jgi:DNA mismatch repair protein MutH
MNWKGIPWARHTLAALVLVIAIGIVAGLFMLEIPTNNKEVAYLVLGVAIGWAGQVVNFHFGSSQGSKDKAEMLSGIKGNDDVN